MFLAALLTGAVALQPLALFPVRPMTLEVRQDPITDHVTAFAVARADRMRLAAGCDPDRYDGVRLTLSGSLWFAGERLLTGRRNFAYRFDRAEPGMSAWSTEDRFAILQPRAYTPRFLGWMAASERLVLRVRDIEGRELDLVFPLAGARAAIEGMLAACGAEDVRAELFPAR